MGKRIKLEKELYRFFENAKDINFCSKECRKEYININPLVAKQIKELKSK
jgi:hypothetical protein